MAKKFEKIKCGDPNCNCTIAFRVIEENTEIQCRKCGKKNIIPSVIQFEKIEPSVVFAKIG